MYIDRLFSLVCQRLVVYNIMEYASTGGSILNYLKKKIFITLRHD